jgi:hypothetical protein
MMGGEREREREGMFRAARSLRAGEGNVRTHR